MCLKEAAAIIQVDWFCTEWLITAVLLKRLEPGHDDSVLPRVHGLSAASAASLSMAVSLRILKLALTFFTLCTQDMREYTMSRFRESKTKVLVATDVAARGLDVNDVDLVIHWDVPTDAETYLHRSGRTARAGNKGTAVMLFGQQDKRRVANIIRCALSD